MTVVWYLPNLPMEDCNISFIQFSAAPWHKWSGSIVGEIRRTKTKLFTVHCDTFSRSPAHAFFIKVSSCSVPHTSNNRFFQLLSSRLHWQHTYTPTRCNRSQFEDFHFCQLDEQRGPALHCSLRRGSPMDRCCGYLHLPGHVPTLGIDCLYALEHIRSRLFLNPLRIFQAEL
jgi:hypothetical protein